MTLTRLSSPFRERRQTSAHIAFPNMRAVVFPRGRCATLFMVALCNMNRINIAFITNTAWPTSSG